MAVRTCVSLFKSRAEMCYTLLAGRYVLFQLCREVFNSNQELKQNTPAYTRTQTRTHIWKHANNFKVQDA